MKRSLSDEPRKRRSSTALYSQRCVAPLLAHAPKYHALVANTTTYLFRRQVGKRVGKGVKVGAVGVEDFQGAEREWKLFKKKWKLL